MAKQIITVGQTKTIRECAVGAVCRAGSECFVPCDITFWTDRNDKPIGKPIPLVREHLKSRLSFKGFGEVTLLKSPTFTIIKDGITGEERIQGYRIPSVRFPSWMRCLKCGRLHYLPWHKYEKQNLKKPDSVEELRCDTHTCRGRLEFVTWVLISAEGYMDDIPWHFLAHRASRKKGEKSDCISYDGLYLNRNRNGRLEIQCRRCKRKPASLSGIRKEDFFSGLSHMRKQPWLQERVAVKELIDNPVAVKITDARVHLPDVVSALDIPPESRIDENDIRARIRQLEGWSFIKPFQKIDLKKHRRLIKRTARFLGVERDEISRALADLEKGWPRTKERQTPLRSDDEMLGAEYQALCTQYHDFNENERFITEHETAGWKTLIKKSDIPARERNILNAVERLVVVKRLREIQVFCGFGRYKKSLINRPGLEEPMEWLPACELYGEGIFLTIDEARLHEWEQLTGCADRAAIVAKRMERSLFQGGSPSPRFILLHTIAHILIKQLEFSAGYPVSSIREKIFSSDKENSPMGGILIYVVVPNKMGSLGGLAEHGKPDKFINLWRTAMEKAEYCTYDPICSEHEGQGPDQLNRAACHGCVLLPEVSCIYNNCLLDRQFIMGNRKGGITGFMKYIQKTDH